MREELQSVAVEAPTCFFRSSVQPPLRKALVQITERCNLHCAHCFVSAGNLGRDMSLDVFADTILPRLKACRVATITLTGGESFVHPDVLAMVTIARSSGFRVGICTNATLITDTQIQQLADLGNVHLNVSLDGFQPESHGRFRGDVSSFDKTIRTIRSLAHSNLLQGILTTPNTLADVAEYAEICSFAAQNGAKYLLMNPLSTMGRGVSTKEKLGASVRAMRDIREITEPYSDRIELVYVRFPNESLPLTSCGAGDIVYVFVGGELTICPYLVFAARSPNSRHNPDEFIVGNMLASGEIAAMLDAFDFHGRYHLGRHPTCRRCTFKSRCGMGCPAAVVASGQRIEQGIDSEVCPKMTGAYRSLHQIPVKLAG